MAKLCLVSLGCAKNLIDSEQMLALIEDAGYELTEDPSQADAAIVNTCAFIESAKSEAIENILAMARYKTEGRLKKLVVTGCLAQRYKEELLREMPEIDALVGTGSYMQILDVLREDGPVCTFGDIDAPISEGGRLISTGPGWAYIKIAEGCSNRCAYCVIPSIRGKYRSRSIGSIVNEASSLAQAGVKELIVVAQDPTRYGSDLYGHRALPELIDKLCAIEGIAWLRLHYLYPDAVDDRLIDAIERNPKVLRYLDIPIQHIDDGILKSMRRRTTGDEIRSLLKKLRERLPGVVLRTSLITGLPGEGEEQFQELCDFLREARIERAGVFPFSPEEGTPAYDMERPDPETAIERAEIVERLQASIMDDFNESRVGATTRVLCEGFDSDMGLYGGRSFAESPDVDGTIWFSAPEAEPGMFYDVTIRGQLDGELVGELADSQDD